MNNIALSIFKIKHTVAIRRQQTGIWATVVALLAFPLTPAQTSSVCQKPWKLSPETEQANSAGPEILLGYVDGASSCPCRTGGSDCSCVVFPVLGPIGKGAFRKVGEGVRGVVTDGALFIRAGSYSEPIVLNKRMLISAYDGPVTIGPSSLAPFDLVADTLDDNLLPLNPKWGAQRKEPNVFPDPKACPHGDSNDSFPCTNQFTYADSGCHPILPVPYCCGPHVNWFGATYQGTVFWHKHEPAVGGDDDYNMRLTRDDKAGYTAANTDSILCEFNAGETINHFSSPLWSSFHAAVDDSDAKARQMIDGRFAIVTGLVGLDCEHDCSSELHPVWALAMNVQPSSDDDLWSFFVRNWGNEGYCGTSQHLVDFPNNRYTFRLPWRAGATSVSVSNQSFHPYHTLSPPPRVTVVPGQAVFVTFSLDGPREDGSMWDGELHLRWSGQS